MTTHKLLLLSVILVFICMEVAAIPTMHLDEADMLLANQGGIPTSYQSAINQYGFAIIRNSSIPCSSISQQVHANYRYHPLSDEDKLGILELEGGRFMREYMAVDEAHAREAFPALLEKDFKVQGKRQDWRLTKAAIMHLLDKEATEIATNERDATDGNHGNNRTINKDSSFVQPRDVGLPEVIVNDITGEVSKLELCLTRGKRTLDNIHLYMCTTCSATTNLGKDYWPHIINEAMCLKADPYCFITTDMVAHGICKQGIIPMQVLKKRQGYCALGLKDGQVVIVEEWSAREHQVRRGCECVINVSSEFAPYVGRFGVEPLRRRTRQRPA